MHNDILNIFSFLIGIIGLVIGVYQTINLTKFKNLVYRQGLDIRERLSHEYNSLYDFENSVSSQNDITWNDSKSEILRSIHERGENIKLIRKTVSMFIGIASGKEVKDEE